MDAYAAELFHAHAEVLEVVVFGSFMKGTWVPGSDLDVFLILEQSNELPRDRIPRYLPERFPVSLDLFPFTRAEMRAQATSPFLAEVARSTWRYSRPAST
ncbi:MAG: nucleotidyltransferase domain-containing protein [Planctomycetota bacterium]